MKLPFRRRQLRTLRKSAYRRRERLHAILDAITDARLSGALIVSSGLFAFTTRDGASAESGCECACFLHASGEPT